MPEGLQPRLITPRFALVVSAGLAYFFSLGMLLPVVPLYVEGPLGHGKLAVGIAVGAFSVGAVLLRPWAGMIGDRFGRRLLIVVGALIVAASGGLYHLATNMGMLVVVRMLGGIGEAAFFVGAGTMVTDLAPEERRGEAISYWTVAVYGGLALGPWLGETLVSGDHYGQVWTVSAVMALAAAAVGFFTTETVTASDPAIARGPLINRAAILPGSVLFLGLIGLAGYTSFIALYVREIGMHDSRSVLALYAGVILSVRIVGARLPDRMGAKRAGTFATITGTIGLLIIAASPRPIALMIGTVVFAVGMSLLYPAMLMLALADLPSNERGSAVGTVSSFFDLSQGLGAAILGGVAALTGYRGAFVAAAVLTMVGLIVLRTASGDRGAARVDQIIETAV